MFLTRVTSPRFLTSYLFISKFICSSVWYVLCSSGFQSHHLVCLRIHPAEMLQMCAASLDPSTSPLTTRSPLSPLRLIVSCSLASSLSFTYHLINWIGAHLSTNLSPCPALSFPEGPTDFEPPTLPLINCWNLLLICNCVLCVGQESNINYDRSILHYPYVSHWNSGNHSCQ